MTKSVVSPSSAIAPSSAAPATVVPCHGALPEVPAHYAIDVSHPGADFKLKIAKAGVYALFCEHHPAEFGLHLQGAKPAAEPAV